MPELRNYHVVLTDGTERNIRSRKLDTEANGTLVFTNNNELVVMYAPGQWKYVEVERQDDKG